MEAQSKRLDACQHRSCKSVAPRARRDWLLCILPLIGLALSVTGLRFTKGVVSHASRRLASVVNGCEFALDLVIIPVV
jgi:hypothetical protein